MNLNLTVRCASLKVYRLADELSRKSETNTWIIIKYQRCTVRSTTKQRKYSIMYHSLTAFLETDSYMYRNQTYQQLIQTNQTKIYYYCLKSKLNYLVFQDLCSYHRFTMTRVVNLFFICLHVFSPWALDLTIVKLWLSLNQWKAQDVAFIHI